MSSSCPLWFHTICRALAFLLLFQSFSPASLRVPWHLDVRCYTSPGSGNWTLDFGLGTLDFGPRPVYGQSADLAPTPDADSTDPFIVQKAQELGNNAAQIFA